MESKLNPLNLGRNRNPLLFLLAVLIPSPAPATDPTSLLSQLAASRDQLPAARADFREERHSRLFSAPVVTEGTVWFVAPDKFRREVRGRSPSITASDGKTLLIYYPAFAEAERYPIGKKAFFDDSLSAITAGMQFENLEQHYRVASSPTADGFVLELTPKKPGIRRLLTKMRIELAPDFSLRRTELHFPNGDRTFTTYKNVVRSKTSDADFTLSLPQNTKIHTPLGD